ncbi:Eco57I restriction-modification methylase domain-containing protein [Halorussus ruber]|uniref:Eco57I restriction-modification methylase domain-containing protein n=1 Tax=Halorussus ruber TaxID=1126238 RepID=UPI001092D547|nr:TaqI-like C-terminal specificity domain-containing protein [Halorussus ruber]
MNTTLDYRTNRDLFSNYYLDEHLPETEDWQTVGEAEVRDAYEEIRDCYRREADRAPGYNERQLRENLLNPVFETLGLTTAVEEPIRGERLRPDYTLFGSERARESAFERREEGRDFHADALGVADAKRWDRSLDAGSKRDFTNPSYQVHVYLDATGLERGILTNGRKWRLYYGPTSHRLDSYYEIDLPALLETGDPEEFKYFYLFFRREAFLGRDGGASEVPAHVGTDRPFVERVHRESNVFAEELSEDLRENVYEALSVLAQGFVDSAGYRGKDSSEYADRETIDDEDLETVYEASLTYLYRLIFVLYAESDGRDLLDTDNEIYRRQYSLNALKRRVADELDRPNPIYQSWQTTLWDRLEELFALIDRGSESQGIPTDDLYVPAYNGGLFKTGEARSASEKRVARDEGPSDHASGQGREQTAKPRDADPDAGEIEAFLASHAVGDTYLAEVIELLTRRESERGEGRAFVDYSSLDVRHLGSIYEGLLEYELEMADEPLLAVRDGGEQEWVPAEEVETAGKDADPVERAEPGEVYLTTETGKRKTTGSYYTPEFVVEYVVEQTLEPLLDEIRADLDPQSPDYADEFAERVFDLSVLDPAMGSGHFLVKTVEYLARAVVEAYQKQVGKVGGDETASETHGIDTPEAHGIDTPDIHWARRQVAQQCIYGVDDNGMAVELAKVSLWLRTLAADQPLAFLDHHLKRGDSLAGTDVAEVEELARDTGPNASLADFGATRADAIGDLMDAYREFAALENETLADVKEMERTYGEIKRDDLRQRLTGMANVHAAERFGLDAPSGAYERMGRALDDEAEWREVAEKSWFRKAQQMADERDFLHWKLAFPEVFYEGDGSAKEESEAGFDAVVGNPPYVRSRNLPDDLKEYYRREFGTASGAYDLYVPFAELAADLGKRVSLVVPNKWTTTDYGRDLRERLLDDWGLREVLDASNLDVFPDADIYPVVVTYGESPRDEPAGDETDEIRVRHPEPDQRGGERELAAAPATSVGKSLVDDLGGHVLPLDLDGEFAETASEVLEECDRLGDHVTLTEGVHTGNVREKLLTDERGAGDDEGDGERDGTLREVVDGKSIDRYRLDWDGTWLRYDESLVERDDGEYADLRDADCFEEPKLLVRDISDRPVAVYDDEEYFALNTLYSVRSRDESDLSLRYLLGVFNSEFATTYFRQVYGGTHVSGDYLRFKPMFARQIPVPDPEDAEVDASEVAERAGVEESVPHDPEAAVAALTERLRAARDERESLNLDVLDYLGKGDGRGSGHGETKRGERRSGPTLAATGVPAAGVGDSVLAETAADRDGLRIGEVRMRNADGELVLEVTARYKPETGERDDRETDRWGYAETDPVPAMRFRDLGETERALVEAFVPAAAERGDGFADFRENATKTNSLLDRLRAIRLPDAEEVREEVARYREVRERAAELDERIAALEDAIDDIVYRLYGIDDEEVRTE